MKRVTQSHKKVVFYVAMLIAAVYLSSVFIIPSASPFIVSVAASTTPKITLRPLNVVAGKNVKVTGTHFTDDSTASITFNGATVASGVAINSTGGFVENFTVPSTTPAGSYPVVATDAAKLTATNTLTVTVKSSSKITITTNGAAHVAGSTIEVEGSGFLDNAKITVTFWGSLAGTATSNSTGGFTVDFAVPAVPAGSYNINATDGTNDAVKAFTVNPHLTASDTTVAPGGSITITGTGFAGSSTVSFTYDGDTLTPSATTTSLGSFSVTLTFPSSLSKGANPLTATDSASNSATIRIKVS